MSTTGAAFEMPYAICLSDLAAVTGGRAAKKNESGATVEDRAAPRGDGKLPAWKKGIIVGAGALGIFVGGEDLVPKRPEHPGRKPGITVEQPIDIPATE